MSYASNNQVGQRQGTGRAVAVALPIFQHHILLNFAAQSELVTADDLTRRILETEPKDEKLK